MMNETPTVVVTDSKTKCPAAVSVCTATGATSVECTAAKEQCVADLQSKATGEVIKTPTNICVPAQSVCTATGMGSVECKAALANCAGSTATPVETVVVTDSAKKCPAAVSVCTATGATSVECTAAKEQCVADLKAKKAAGDANIITNPLQAAKKAAMTSEKHSYLQQLYQKAGHVTDPCLSAKSVCTATGLEQPACVSALVDAKAANCPLTWYQAPVVAEPVTTLPLTISPVIAQPVMTVDPVMTTTASYL
jgi:hypothetical protein